jgi:hypothetical protein
MTISRTATTVFRRASLGSPRATGAGLAHDESGGGTRSGTVHHGPLLEVPHVPAR